MKTLEIDIETHSSVDLSKCGVYKYVEADDFKIILFGYSIDGEDVCVIDLARGEKLPVEVLSALEDDSVIKYAFNASFERICISRFLGYPTGDYLDPSSWRCSMIWSAYLGLPLSLKGVGAVLGLDKQKMDEGKDLIKYFCQPCAPTKSNGGRTRNLPSDAPNKWTAFKDYNKRDVEVEMEIQQKLAKFPVPDSVWDEYHLSEEINDRGIRVRDYSTRLMSCSFEGERVSKSRSTEAPFVRVIEKIIDLEKVINRDIDRYVDLKTEMNAAIDRVSNVDERLLLRYRYLNNYSWDDIAQLLNVSGRTVHRIHSSALYNFPVPV